MATTSMPAGVSYVLATGVSVKWHDRAWGNPANGTVTNAPADATFVFLGFFDQLDSRTISLDETIVGDGALTVGVSFDREIPGQWVRLPASAPAALFKTAYNVAGEASATSTGNAALGVVLDVDTLGNRAFVAYSF